MDDPSPSPTPQASPFLSLWFKPRATMRRPLEDGYDRWNYLLAAARGAGFVCYLPTTDFLNGQLSLGSLCLAVLVVGPLIGVVLLPLRAWAITVAANTLGGEATYQRTRGAIAWAGIIGCWATVFWGLALAVAVFAGAFDAQHQVEIENPSAAQLLLDWLFTILLIWHTFVEFRCVGESSRLSLGAAWGAEILGHGLLVCVLLVPVVAILCGYAVLFSPPM